MSGQARHHDIRSGGPWPPKSETAPPALDAQSRDTSHRRDDTRSVDFDHALSPSGVPGTRRPAGSVGRRQVPGPLRPWNRHTPVVATTWAGILCSRHVARVAVVLALAGGFLRMVLTVVGQPAV